MCQNWSKKRGKGKKLHTKVGPKRENKIKWEIRMEAQIAPNTHY